MKQVGIIGGSGFIGSYITKKFLEEGFGVRISSRDISKKENYQHLKNLDKSENLEIYSLDVRNLDALKKFAEGCDILVHSGTPFQLDVKDPKKELLDPTIKGTESFLTVVSELKSLKKVVFLASVAAFNTAFPLPADDKSPDHVYSENDDPFIHEDNHPYAQAKYFADQTVRKFVKEHPDIRFEVVSVYPTFVTGKSLSNRQDSTSTGMQFLLKNKIAPNPFVEMLFQQDLEFALVDVADVAESIFKAATKKGLHGKNYLLTSESWKVSDITLMLNKQQPTGKLRIVYSNDAATKDLGVHFKPAIVPLNQFEQE